ncbi:hypothetical protein HGO38_01560 [Rhizobium sp. CG5]|uniref:hypothetical protein n=1 Tax=Rhizobium sp. CG5 TaxID=2726076 RepID=UPI0020348CCD|nr:hypothetical protein [Rhizobium sp. CG5]MCM2472163.1 hypothetical protein [Rhizobium sp. CG5]
MTEPSADGQTVRISATAALRESELREQILKQRCAILASAVDEMALELQRIQDDVMRLQSENARLKADKEETD